MKSIAYIPGSNGSGNASQMTVQNVRSSGASDILVNTVTGVPTKFYGSMGAPHTFTDPVTGETITIISEATAVDFAGHVDTGKLVIDAIAPGYVDTRGSLVGDIVVVRPNTEWANNLFNVLSQSHNDDGTIKDSAITYNANVFDHVASGAILAGLGYGSTLTASLSEGVAYINGIKQTIAAVATRTYTASKDTYVDVLYNSSGTATVVYTEVANNASSPALASNSVRIGIIVSGAGNIAAVESVNQGQDTRLLPLVSSVPLAVTDSLGNLIFPRSPDRKRLGGAQVVTNGITTSVTLAAFSPSLAVTFIAPGRRDIKVTVSGSFSGSTATGGYSMGVLEGSTVLGLKTWTQTSTGGYLPIDLVFIVPAPTAGIHTYTVAGAASTGTVIMQASALGNNIIAGPTKILIELD